MSNFDKNNSEKKPGNPLFYVNRNNLYLRQFDIKSELSCINFSNSKDDENMNYNSSFFDGNNPNSENNNLSFLEKNLLQLELKSLGSVHLNEIHDKILAIIRHSYVQYVMESL